MDLSGKWRMVLDEKMGKTAPLNYTDEIILPDSLSHAQKVPFNCNEESGFMTDTYSYEGAAWFSRDFVVDKADAGKAAFLTLERTRITAAFIDGNEVGRKDTLCTSQRFSLETLEEGKHNVAICVSNINYPTKGGHMTSPDTQTNWIGILGRMSIDFYDGAYPVSVMIFPDAKTGNVNVKLYMSDKSSGNLSYEISGVKKADVSFSDGECCFGFCISDFKLWDEYKHNTYTLRITCNGCISENTFGFRSVKTVGRKIYINGNEVFLRGKHDGMIFPKTGYAPMEKEKWSEIFRIAKQYGINHYRFHTCCPPNAAFEAADEVGIYLQPELPFWGTVSDNENDPEQSYLVNEGFLILREFGNHPSFLMMSLGNELWGSKERINAILGEYKAFDDRHLYTGGSNNFQFWPTVLENEDFFSGVRLSKDRLIRGSYAMCDAPLGFVQTDCPSSNHSYDDIVNDGNADFSGGGKISIQYGTGVKEVDAGENGGSFVPAVPIITHEVGQYYMYPDFEEAQLYKGSIKPLYLNIFRKRLEEKGIFDDHRKFFLASSALAVECYKAECEAALNSDTIAGFQLLDIQDFTGQGVATVGILNALMQSKGIIEAGDWRKFCSDTVVLTSFDRFVFSNDDNIEADIRLFNVNPDLSERIAFTCTANGYKQNIELTKGSRLSKPVHISYKYENCNTPIYTDFSITSSDGAISNSYGLWIYPKLNATITENELICSGKRLRIAKSIREAELLKEAGEKAIVIPERGENCIDSVYCTDFWNYPMFSSISRSMNKPLPTGTLGLCIDDSHPALKYFNSRSYTTPQWHNFITHAHCEIITEVDGEPIVQMIDNIERCERLGLLYEENGIPVCTSKLWEIADAPEIPWLVLGLTEYYGKPYAN